MQQNNREISILKSRILRFLDFKKEKKSVFYKKTGISNGILSQPGGLSEENLLRFLNTYTDISLYWFIFGIGDMLNDAQKSVEYYDILLIDECNKKGNKIIELLEENAKLKEEIYKSHK